MKSIDLFCGAGGAAMGLHQAGFEVTGIDIVYQKNFPWNRRLIVKDVMTVSIDYLREFDLIWASPPCQKYSIMRRGRWKKREHPDLIEPVRKMLKESGKPYVIENVPGAPLIDPVMLCGSMFGLEINEGNQIRRHRSFECSFPARQPECRHNNLRTVNVYGNSGGYSKRDGIQFFKTQDWRDAMGIQWMTGKELSQAIPPAYSKYIAEQFLVYLKKS